MLKSSAGINFISYYSFCFDFHWNCMAFTCCWLAGWLLADWLNYLRTYLPIINFRCITNKKNLHKSQTVSHVSRLNLLNLFWQIFPCYTPWKHQIAPFFVFSGDIWWEHRLNDFVYLQLYKFYLLQTLSCLYAPSLVILEALMKRWKSCF